MLSFVPKSSYFQCDQASKTAIKSNLRFFHNQKIGDNSNSIQSCQIPVFKGFWWPGHTVTDFTSCETLTNQNPFRVKIVSSVDQSKPLNS